MRNSRNNKYLAWSLGFLTILSVTLFFLTREEDKPEIDRAYFAVAETEKLDRVLLQSPKDTVVLTFDGIRWKVNDQWEADMQMIKVLMATLRQVEPHRPVSAAVKDTVISQLNGGGTRVVVEEGGQMRMNFLAGGNAQKTESWFLRDADQQPYVVIIPGYRVYVSGILQLPEGGWRNKRIFEFNWRNFKSLESVYPGEPGQGFRIEMKQRYFGIEGMAQVDTTKLNDYLDAVSLLLATRFVSASDRVADSVMVKAPSARIDIQDIANRTYTLELFAPRKNDAEVYGRMAGGQIVAFDRDAISAIARRRTYFVAATAR